MKNTPHFKSVVYNLYILYAIFFWHLLSRFFSWLRYCQPFHFVSSPPLRPGPQDGSHYESHIYFGRLSPPYYQHGSFFLYSV